MSLHRNVAGLILGVALLGAVAVAQNDDTPLGDVARQQSGKKAVVTVDDDNFQRTTPPPAPAADTKSGDSAKADAGDKADAKGGDKTDAAPSQDDVKALEKQLADLKQNRDITSDQVGRLQSKLDGSDLTDDMRQSLAEAQATYKERLAGINAQIPALEKKLEAARAAQKSDSGDAGSGDDSSKPADAKTPEAKPDDSDKSK